MQQDQSQLQSPFFADLRSLEERAILPNGARPESRSESGAAISARAFRDALGRYASGITVITSIDDLGPIGFTCQSFYSVSTNPPLISISVQKTSNTYPRIRRAGSFAVNVLAQGQQHVSNQFARSGTDKWQGMEWSRSQAGNPVLDNTLMWLDCRIWAEHDAGDHLIVLGKVEEISLSDGSSEGPLLYFKGQYRQLSQESLT